MLNIHNLQYDKWSVGSPPMKSIFIYGLNDNVNQEFLLGLFQPLGSIDQLKVSVQIYINCCPLSTKFHSNINFEISV